MDPWEILGIEPTDELRVVKRAYAKKVKETRPEEDPQGFQALNEAYEYIVDCIRNDLPIAKEASEAPAASEEPVVSQAPAASKEEPAVSEGFTANEAPATEDVVDFRSQGEVLEQFSALLLQIAQNSGEHNAQAWQDSDDVVEQYTQAWLVFLNEPEFVDIDYKRHISYPAFYELIEFFAANEHHNLPSEVKSRLLEVFAWHENELEMCKHFGHDHVDLVLTKLVPQLASQELEQQQHGTSAPDIQIDPAVFKMLGGIVCLLMAFVLVAVG